MRTFKATTVFAVVIATLMIAGNTKAVDIGGPAPITSTLTIFEDSRLISDVTCSVANGPCISLGAPNITLRLNGFTLTGPAESASLTNCATNFAAGQDGISAVQQSDVRIIGPGIVQKFSRHGISLFGNITQSTGTGITVSRVTINQNCYSGIFMGGVSNSDIIDNVSVRNSNASEFRPCGGNCITNSNNNRILRNVFNGNGSVYGTAGNNDFGAGLVGTSTGNLLQENAIGGNTQGVFIDPGAVGNIIRRNIIAGNPPIQVSALFDHPLPIGPVGFDIRNLSPAGANVFDNNLCMTYSGASNTSNPAPCQNVPNISGHRNSTILKIIGKPL